VNKDKRKGRGRAGAPALYYLSQLQSGDLVGAEHREPGSPLGATVIPNGSLPFTTLDVALISPVGEMCAMLPPVERVNHMEPSGPAGAMSSGPPSAGKRVTLLASGSRRPTACGVKRSVNHTAPSLAMLISRGKPSTSISVMPPVVGFSRPI
jgi:hypothetical protein